MTVKTIIRIKFNEAHLSKLIEIGRKVTGYNAVENDDYKVVVISKRLQNPILFTHVSNFSKREAFNISHSQFGQTIKTNVLEFHISDSYDDVIEKDFVREFVTRCNLAIEMFGWQEEFFIEEVKVEEVITQSRTFSFNNSGERVFN